MKLDVFFLIATGYDSHITEHPAAFLPPPPSLEKSRTSHWLNIWMEKDGCLLKKGAKTLCGPLYVRHAFRRDFFGMLSQTIFYCNFKSANKLKDKLPVSVLVCFPANMQVLFHFLLIALFLSPD